MCRQRTSRVQLIFCHQNNATITLPLECDCSTFAPHLKKRLRSALYQNMSCLAVVWRHRRTFEKRIQQSTRKSYPYNAYLVRTHHPLLSPCLRRQAVPGGHGCMNCHVISHQVQTCFFRLVFRIASNCRHGHSPLLPDRQTAAGSDVAHMCAAKLLHNGIRVQQWSHTTTRQAMWYNAWACRDNASDANKPGTSPDRDIVTMVDIFFFCHAWALDDLLAWPALLELLAQIPGMLRGAFFFRLRLGWLTYPCHIPSSCQSAGLAQRKGIWSWMAVLVSDRCCRNVQACRSSCGDRTRSGR